MDNLLTIDIGNSSTSLGVFFNKKVVLIDSFCTCKTDDENTLKQKLVDVLQINKKEINVKRAIVASVVPEMDSHISTALRNIGIESVKFLTNQTSLGLKISIAEPESVGADRIANAIAAKNEYKLPALVVDVGTATSFDYIDLSGSFAGGVIMPGPTISFEALKARASKLKDIKLGWTDSVLGKSTAEAINSGVNHGHLFAVEGLVNAIEEEVGGIASIVVTGGAGQSLIDNSKKFEIYDPLLTLKGLEIVGDDK